MDTSKGAGKWSDSTPIFESTATAQGSSLTHTVSATPPVKSPRTTNTNSTTPSRRRLQQSNPPNLNRRPTPSNNNLDPTPLPNLFGRRLVSPLISHQSTPTLSDTD